MIEYVNMGSEMNAPARPQSRERYLARHKLGHSGESQDSSTCQTGATEIRAMKTDIPDLPKRPPPVKTQFSNPNLITGMSGGLGSAGIPTSAGDNMTSSLNHPPRASGEFIMPSAHANPFALGDDTEGEATDYTADHKGDRSIRTARENTSQNQSVKDKESSKKFSEGVTDKGHISVHNGPDSANSAGTVTMDGDEKVANEEKKPPMSVVSLAKKQAQEADKEGDGQGMATKQELQDDVKDPELSGETSYEKICSSMRGVVRTVEISDKTMDSDLVKEEKYWVAQQLAFDRLYQRVLAGQRTLNDFAALLKKMQRAAASAAKYLSMQGQWESLGEFEGLGMQKVCVAQQELIKSLGDYYETLQSDLYTKPMAEASAAAKDIGVFAAKIQKEANQINNTIKKQRDLATKKWGNYKWAVAKRHRSMEQQKIMKGSDDPYLYFVAYKREILKLHRLQESYNNNMAKMMAEFETREYQRFRCVRNLMLGLISTQKSLFDNAHIMCAQEIGKLSEVNLEADVLRFRQSGGLLHDASTIVIEFMPTAFGIDFKGNRISNVLPGAQAAKLGVQVGWRILNINGKAAPTTHKEIASVLQNLKKVGKPISVRFGKNQECMIFSSPPPRRRTQHIAILSNSELATVGDLSRMSRTIGFTSWTKMHCVITCSGILHILNNAESTSPHSSILLHASTVRLAPKVDQYAFEIEEATGGFFSGQRVHTFRTKTEGALVDWVCEIKKFLKSAKLGIKPTK